MLEPNHEIVGVANHNHFAFRHFLVRIPGHPDHRSGVIPITIPG
jgi:hypothetical protein